MILQSSKTEESLTVELQSMRDQVWNKKTSMSDHVQILETLREEITIMTERKMDLERRIEALYAEREGLSSTLDESADRIVMLEKEARERDCLVSKTNNCTYHTFYHSRWMVWMIVDRYGCDDLQIIISLLQIRNIKKESDELKTQNLSLNDRLDSVYRR